MGSRRHARLAPLSLRFISKPSKEVLQQLYLVELSAHRDPWTPDDIASTFSPNTRCIGLYLKEELIGFAIICIVYDEAELYTIGVNPKYQGLGFGRKLLAATLKECLNLGAARCFLEVRVSNAVAFHLYDSYGFTVTGTRRNYYPGSNGEPAEDAYTMACDLSTLATVATLPIEPDPAAHATSAAPADSAAPQQ